MRWIQQDRGDRIEAFVHEMATSDPRLMREVLRIGFGSLMRWLDVGQEVRSATCGCLVGTCAIAATKLGRVDAKRVRAEHPMTYNLAQVVPLILAVACGDAALAATIYSLGGDVSRECLKGTTGLWPDTRARQDEIKKYLADLIRVDLALIHGW